MSSLALFAVSLGGAHLLTFVLHWGRQLEQVLVSQECRGAAETIGQDLYRTLVEEELQVHAEHTARIVDRKSGDVLAHVHLLAAAPASVLARWRMTWKGPERVVPHVQYTVVSDAKDERAAIIANGGVVEQELLATSAWMSDLREILGAACATPGEK